MMTTAAAPNLPHTPYDHHARNRVPELGGGYPVTRPPRPARQAFTLPPCRAAIMPPIGGIHYDAQEVVPMRGCGDRTGRSRYVSLAQRSCLTCCVPSPRLTPLGAAIIMAALAAGSCERIRLREVGHHA